MCRHALPCLVHSLYRYPSLEVHILHQMDQNTILFLLNAHMERMYKRMCIRMPYDSPVQNNILFLLLAVGLINRNERMWYCSEIHGNPFSLGWQYVYRSYYMYTASGYSLALKNRKQYGAFLLIAKILK